MNSGPLSTRIISGLPRVNTNFSNTRMTRTACMEVSASIANVAMAGKSFEFEPRMLSKLIVHYLAANP